MRSLLNYLIMPLTIFWLLLLAGVVLYLFKRKRAGWVCGYISIIWLLLISLPFLPELLVRSLEKRYPPLSETVKFQVTDTINILVLGGGHTDSNNFPPNDQLSHNALGRLTEGIRLKRLLGNSRLIFSGSTGNENVSQAMKLKQTALSLGVPGKDIILIIAPENTQMESVDYTQKFGTDKVLVLITDAIHMPRAMFHFLKAGQSPIPAPTNHLVKSDHKNGISAWGPSAANISRMESAVHEYAGLAWGKLGGK